MSMTSCKPYLIRAHYEWIVDNDCTPYLIVDAYSDGVSVPQQYVNKDGQIILNVSPNAVMSLDLGTEAITFNARFGGVPIDIYVPCFAVLGIYARENGRGMMFELETPPEPPEPTKPKKATIAPAPSDSNNSSKSGQNSTRPSLRVIK
ncbi:ClpXP protease specificity-enhancing factor [Sessilibacter corallicola]|uniref:ClpXP protease specificity-enhancing factor n=1 Tax=Sessilibacter corallicola TaxID=2904075 RepID=UPI001E488184|nr:ClpXP protease specificity-enhancing factor [Sessilibacter corallicola]MCE2027130.1 ClpXP protease specificity-enhancing factor [Sessilibacter corallicola]